MEPVPHWRRVLKRAWSIRFIVAAFIFSALEVALPYLDGLLPVEPRFFAVLTGLAAGAAFVSRLIAQKGVTPCP